MEGAWEGDPPVEVELERGAEDSAEPRAVRAHAPLTRAVPPRRLVREVERESERRRAGEGRASQRAW